MSGQGRRGEAARGGGQPTGVAAAARALAEREATPADPASRGRFSAGTELLAREMSYGATLRPAAVEDFGIEDGDDAESDLRFA